MTGYSEIFTKIIFAEGLNIGNHTDLSVIRYEEYLKLNEAKLIEILAVMSTIIP